MSEREAHFREPTITRATKDLDSPQVFYMGMSGRISVASLLAHMATIAPDVAPEEMMLNFATVKWQRDPTPEVIAERQRQQRAHEERTEAWERKTLARLQAKYGRFPSLARKADQ